MLKYFSTGYLVGTGKTQAVEDRNKDVCWDKETQEVGAAQEPVLRPVGIDFSRCSQDGYG